jgi:hypothetical protein
MSLKIDHVRGATTFGARPPLPAHIDRLLATAGLPRHPAGKFSLAQVDSALRKAGMTIDERMAAKDALHRSHLLD